MKIKLNIILCSILVVFILGSVFPNEEVIRNEELGVRNEELDRDRMPIFPIPNSSSLIPHSSPSPSSLLTSPLQEVVVFPQLGQVR